MAYLSFVIVSVIYLSTGVAGITDPSRNTTVHIGQPASLQCNADDGALVEWIYNGTKIYDSRSGNATDDLVYLGLGDELIIRDVQPENTGVYTCRVPDEDKEVNFFVVGLEPLSCSEDMVLDEGDRFQLVCNATFYSDDAGHLAPILDWYRGDSVIGAFSNRFVKETFVKYSIKETADPDDNGQFTCKVSYRKISSQTWPLPLYPLDAMCSTSVIVNYGPKDMAVVPKPDFRSWNVKAKVGEHVNCTAAGNPEPVITWMDEDGEEVSSTFQLLVTKEMKGYRKFTCIARNTVGGMAKNETMSVTVTSEEIREDSNGAKHNVPLVSTLLLCWVVIRYAW